MLRELCRSNIFAEGHIWKRRWTKPENNSILDYVLAAAIGSEIHEVEVSIHRMVLALGLLLLELFVLSAGTGKTGVNVGIRSREEAALSS